MSNPYISTQNWKTRRHLVMLTISLSGLNNGVTHLSGLGLDANNRQAGI